MNPHFELSIKPLLLTEWIDCPVISGNNNVFLVISQHSPWFYGSWICVSQVCGVNETLQPFRPVQLRFSRSVHGSGSLLSIELNSCIRRTVV
jgi:hypothetical protein